MWKQWRLRSSRQKFHLNNARHIWIHQCKGTQLWKQNGHLHIIGSRLSYISGKALCPWDNLQNKNRRESMRRGRKPRRNSSRAHAEQNDLKVQSVCYWLNSVWIKVNNYIFYLWCMGLIKEKHKNTEVEMCCSFIRSIFIKQVYCVYW